MYPNNVCDVPSRHVEESLPNHCITNCENYVAEHGGHAVVGWRVNELGPLLELSHHAVWKSPEGDLFDITPHAVGRTGDTLVSFFTPIKYVVDESAQFVGTSPHRRSLANRYEPRSGDPRLLVACSYLRRSDELIYGGQYEQGRYWSDKANKVLHKFGCQVGCPDQCLAELCMGPAVEDAGVSQ